MNVPKLKGKLAEREMNVEELAALIGMKRATLYRKLRDSRKVTIGEAQKIKEAMNLSDIEASEIFLN